MSIRSVDEQQFESEVLKSDVPVLVDFWAEWCGPCKMLLPMLDSVSEEFGSKLKIVKLNVDDFPDVAMRYGVRSLPTLVVFRDGEQVDQKTGTMPKSSLEGWMRRHVQCEPVGS